MISKDFRESVRESHVYAYFMHTYLFISFLFFVFGCDVFSLSLSWIDCAMVPKAHKSTLGWNPLQGSSSSSSDPIPPLHVWFHDEKA